MVHGPGSGYLGGDASPIPAEERHKVKALQEVSPSTRAKLLNS